jgi:hypothetical protein
MTDMSITTLPGSGFCRSITAPKYDDVSVCAPGGPSGPVPLCGMAQREQRWDNGFALKKPREGRHKVSSQGYAAPGGAPLQRLRLYPRLFAVGQTMSALTGLA